MTDRNAPHDVTGSYWRLIAPPRGFRGKVGRMYCSICHRRAGVTFSEALIEVTGSSPSWKHHMDGRFDTPEPAWLAAAEMARIAAIGETLDANEYVH